MFGGSDRAMRIRVGFVLVACLLLVGLLIACPAPRPSCATDNDCIGTGFLCSNGACTPRPRCADDQQCPLGEICDNNDSDPNFPASFVCVPGCREDKGCKDNQNCFQGVCQPAVCGPRAKDTQEMSTSCYSREGKESEVAQGVIDKGGQCRRGTRYCINNGTAWSTCFGEVLPASTEICDKIDNNCNGLVDEGLDCKCLPGDFRSCSTLPNSAVIRKADNVSQCSRGIQFCEASKDNPDVGTWGGCRKQGVPNPSRIQPGGKAPANPTPADVLAATCFVRDSDCDGKLDKGANCECTKEDFDTSKTRTCYPFDAETKGKGTCQVGKQSCSKGCRIEETNGKCPADAVYYYWSVCTGAVLPVPEETLDCNGKDDDCDGKVDNRTDQPDKPLVRPCYPSQTVGCKEDGKDCVGACRFGLETCQDGLWSRCQGAVLPWDKEDCNNKDDDCNGFVDDKLDSVSCYTGTTGCTRKPDGTYECKGICQPGKGNCSTDGSGKWKTCTGEVLPGEESKAAGTCADGKDNDCDGKTDAQDSDCQ